MCVLRDYIGPQTLGGKISAMEGVHNHYFAWRCLGHYTKYDIQCHMVFNVTMRIFWMTLLMNK